MSITDKHRKKLRVPGVLPGAGWRGAGLNLKGNVKHTANLLFGLMSKTELWKGLYG